MSSVQIQRLFWLLDTINTFEPVTFKMIDSQWQKSQLNNTCAEYATRTFRDHIDAIRDSFGIEIKCNSKNEYYIKREKGNPIVDWLMESFSISTMTNEAQNLKKLIVLEEVPSGNKWLTIIMRAMRQKQCLRITHQSFKKDTPTTRNMEPYFIQMHNRRWYVFAINKADKKMFTLSLDRICNIEMLEERFKISKNYEPKKYLSKGYGVSIYDDIEPEIVKIKATGYAPKYLRSLPLHESQKEIETNEEYSIFQLKVPAVDEFFLDLLHHGPSLEIIEPTHFREHFKKIVMELAQKYAK
ncbi:MAG: WYL domain-containing protein [Bacteroidales bacterium]|nr:WYL domain-containing protein [Bacteroidales bacterium]